MRVPLPAASTTVNSPAILIPPNYAYECRQNKSSASEKQPQRAASSHKNYHKIIKSPCFSRFSCAFTEFFSVMRQEKAIQTYFYFKKKSRYLQVFAGRNLAINAILLNFPVFLKRF
jgi:hypothetical protein